MFVKNVPISLAFNTNVSNILKQFTMQLEQANGLTIGKVSAG
jgi:hypothetical protein